MGSLQKTFSKDEKTVFSHGFGMEDKEYEQKCRYSGKQVNPDGNQGHAQILASTI